MDVTVKSDLPPVLEFRSLKPFDRYEVEDLHARLVGTGLENTLEAVFDEDTGAFGIVATEAESVVGYGIVLVLDRNAAKDYFRFGTADYPIGETNAVMHALAVEESWQGRGIGSELLRLRLAIARDAARRQLRPLPPGQGERMRWRRWELPTQRCARTRAFHRMDRRRPR